MNLQNMYSSPVEKRKYQEMKNGYIGELMGVKLYLLEDL